MHSYDFRLFYYAIASILGIVLGQYLRKKYFSRLLVFTVIVIYFINTSIFFSNIEFSDLTMSVVWTSALFFIIIGLIISIPFLNQHIISQLLLVCCYMLILLMTSIQLVCSNVMPRYNHTPSRISKIDSNYSYLFSYNPGSAIDRAFATISIRKRIPYLPIFCITYKTFHFDNDAPEDVLVGISEKNNTKTIYIYEPIMKLVETKDSVTGEEIRRRYPDFLTLDSLVVD